MCVPHVAFGLIRRETQYSYVSNKHNNSSTVLFQIIQNQNKYKYYKTKLAYNKKTIIF